MATNLNLSLLDEDIPDIGKEPLKPTKYEYIKKTVTNFVKDNANKVADWIINLKLPAIIKVLPLKILDMILWTKYITYKNHLQPSYWQINIPQSDEKVIDEKIKEAKMKYGEKGFSKYLKTFYYNKVESWNDIEKYLMETYDREHNAFKLMISFGYVTEKLNDSGNWEVTVYKPRQKYYHDEPQIIKNKTMMQNIISKITKENIISRLAESFPDTKTKLIGIYSLGVKITRLDYPIGSNIKLPEYIKASRYIVSLEDVNNNMCFWSCIALAGGARRDRFKEKAKELYRNYYKIPICDSYDGFDYVNELDKYERFNSRYAINIVKYFDDESVEYVRKSSYNSNRTVIYLNLYSDHFSYITSLEKLCKMYVCHRCSGKFRDNYNLVRHIDSCKLEQEDTFVKYPQIYEKKRNLIVELSEWFNVDCDYKHDYLIAFDFESVMQKIDEKCGDKLEFVSEHIPISESLATNVPGFEGEHFILSIDPYNICKQMFEYLDRVAEKSKQLMMNKMKQLLERIEVHYNEDERQKFLIKVESYCSNIPVVGFNSSFYDINLAAKYGFIKEILSRDTSPMIIKSGTRYKVIKTNQFTFLDQMGYCAPGTDLSQFIKAYDIGQQKGYFPYEWFDSHEKLDYLVSDLKIENFDSSLKNTKLDQDSFDSLTNTCKTLHIVYVRDLLKWYNNLDVGPMLKACLKQKEFYYKFKLDMYKDGSSLPGLSENILFQFSLQGFEKYLEEKPDIDISKFSSPKDIDIKLKGYKQQDRKANRCLDNSINQHEVQSLFEKQKYLCYYCWNSKTISNWSLDRIDCSLGHISGNCVIACVKCNVERKDTLQKKFYRKKALLRFAETHPMIHLIDERNKRVFYKIKKNIIGGPSIVYHRYHEKNVTKINRVHYNAETKKWYYNEDGKTVHSIVGFDANSLYLNCLDQDMLCGQLEWISTNEEYKIEYESETIGFNDDEKKIYEQERKLCSKAQIIKDELEEVVQKGNWIEFLESFYGILEVDIEVSEAKYEKFGEMPPIFKNIEYNEEESGEYMSQIILDTNDKLSKNRKLIASLKGSRILMMSNQLKWLLEKGLNITKVYGVIPAKRGRPFSDFVKWCSDERREGDKDIQYAIIGESAKTTGNSAYGRTGMNKNKFKNVRFCDEKQFNRAKNNYFYYDADEYDGIYEISLRPKKIKQNMPIQVAFGVLNHAKLRMLEFYYDCIDKYIDRNDYQYIYMDTDSAYMALSDDFQNLIKPELRNEFNKDKNNWFPRSDTPENKAFDKRKPGLFKVEYQGTGMVALCSKTYYTWGIKDKFSIKGVQKNKNKDIISKEFYKKCLHDKETKNYSNKGFRYVNGTMKTYEQEKSGLTPIYVKGVVMSDGVHIHPLDI